MAQTQVACPNKRHRSANYRVVGRGVRKTKDGAVARYECVSSRGARHWFTLPMEADQLPSKVSQAAVRCPNARHRDARVQSRGKVQTADGTWARYQCTKPNGERHWFRLLLTPAGPTSRDAGPPPACLEHPGSRVVRHGSFGTGGKKRQRYRCEPIEGGMHTFSPPLTREVVGAGSTCTTCDELLSPHRGTLTAARHTPWTLPGVVQALNDLSLGSSYAAVSLALRAQRDRAWEHLHDVHGIDIPLREVPESDPADTGWPRRRARNAWRLGADLVEQYAPLLFAGVREQIEKREFALRHTNDALLHLHPKAALERPIVYVLDELPIVITARPTKSRRLQQNTWSLLVVVELLWHPSANPHTLPEREARLRLARAYPRGNTQAWRLVLHELPVRPDFVVADASDAIRNAVRLHYGENRVPLVPSLFHIQKNLRAALSKLPSATIQVNGRTTLVDALGKWMQIVTRGELLNRSEIDISNWWDGLIETVRRLPAPTTSIEAMRTVNEPLMQQLLPLLQQQPQLPASNAAVELRIRQTLDPFLENRKHLYRNIARTNFLLDLAVCRAQGAFLNTDGLTKFIRDNNESFRGWAPQPRAIVDEQPPPRPGQPRVIYSSLLNPLLLPALATARGVPAQSPHRVAPARPVRKPTGRPPGRPKGSKNRSQVAP